jgi:hypothetical protein
MATPVAAGRRREITTEQWRGTARFSGLLRPAAISRQATVTLPPGNRLLLPTVTTRYPCATAPCIGSSLD